MVEEVIGIPVEIIWPIVAIVVSYFAKEGSNKYNERKSKERELEFKENVPKIERVPVDVINQVSDKISSAISSTVTIVLAKMFPDRDIEIEDDNIDEKLKIPNARDTLLNQMSNEFNNQFERFSSQIQQSFKDQDERLDNIENKLTSFNIRISKLEADK